MAVPEGSTGRSFGLGLAAVVAVGVLARLALMVPGFEPRTDPDRYLVLARSLAEGKGFALGGRPTAYRPPLYPILLTPLVATLGDQLAWGVAALHLVLGAGTVALTALAGRRWGLSPARALIASAIVACDPVLLAQARVVMTETPSAFLVAAVLAALAGDARRGPLLGGLAFGLAALCRPSFLPAAGLTAAAALFARPGDGLRAAASRDGADGRDGRDARALGLAQRARPRRAGLDDDPRRLHAGAGQQPRLLRRGARRPAGRGLVGAGPAALVRGGPPRQAELSEPEFDRRMRAEGLRMLAERPRLRPRLRWPGCGGSGASRPPTRSTPGSSAWPPPPGRSRSGSPWSSGSRAGPPGAGRRSPLRPSCWRCRRSTPSSGPT